MEMRQSNGVLEITKRGFNSPSHVIQRFDFFRRKSISVQIRNDTLIRILCDFKTNNTKIHIIVQIGMNIQNCCFTLTLTFTSAAADVHETIFCSLLIHDAPSQDAA